MKTAFNQKQLKEIKKKMQKISALKSHEVIAAFRKAALVLENRVKLNLRGPILKTRSGRLAQSIGTTVCEQQGHLAAFIGSGQRTGQPAAYADLLETGGMVRPVKKNWLTLPLPPNLTPAGTMRFSAREVPHGFIRQNKNGNLILYSAAQKKIVPMFVLKKQVHIPAKRYLALSLEQGKQQAFDYLSSALGALAEGK